jgi:hypothetical protein
MRRGVAGERGEQQPEIRAEEFSAHGRHPVAAMRAR